MLEKWMLSGWENIPIVLVSATVIYITILLYTRLAGLRSFSKMSASDFAMTVAVGSLFASTASLSTPSLIIGITALAGLYGGQWLLAWGRRRYQIVGKIVDNEPLLLMAGRTILDKNLEQANVTRSDLFAKLREANALNYDDVLAVIFETTGDISVLHSNDANARLEPDFLKDVIDAEQLFVQSQGQTEHQANS